MSQNNDNKVQVIDPQDLKAIHEASAKMTMTLSLAEKAATEAKLAATERQSLVQHIFLKYGLTLNDSINDQDGTITYGALKNTPAVEAEQPEPEASPELEQDPELEQEPEPEQEPELLEEEEKPKKTAKTRKKRERRRKAA